MKNEDRRSKTNGSEKEYNLSNIGDLVSTCQIGGLNHLTPLSLMIIPTHNFVHGNKQTVIMHYHEPPLLVSKSANWLVKEYDEKRLFSYDTTRKGLIAQLGARNKMPLFCVDSVWIPLGQHAKSDMPWFNLFHLADVQKYIPRNYYTSETLLIFQNGFEIVLPRAHQTTLKSLKKDIAFATVYFKFLQYLFENNGATEFQALDKMKDVLERFPKLAPTVEARVDYQALEEHLFLLAAIERFPELAWAISDGK